MNLRIYYNEYRVNLLNVLHFENELTDTSGDFTDPFSFLDVAKYLTNKKNISNIRI